MFELVFVVIRPVAKPTSLSSNFEIENKRVLYGDEKRSRRLSPHGRDGTYSGTFCKRRNGDGEYGELTKGTTWLLTWLPLPASSSL